MSVFNYKDTLGRGIKMAYAFDTQSIPGKVIVHAVQFESYTIDMFEGFSETGFYLIHPDNDKRLDLLASCLIKE